MRVLMLVIAAFMAADALAGCECASIDTMRLDTVPNTIQVIRPNGTQSSWPTDHRIGLSLKGGFDDGTVLALDDAWREAIRAVVGINDVATGTAIDFDMQQMPSGPVSLVPAIPFVADAAYRVTLQPGTVQAAVKDLRVQNADHTEVTVAPACFYIYTGSRPVVASVGLWMTEFGDLRVDFGGSERLREDGLVGPPKVQLLVDGTDLTICQGPPSCCITGTTADGGMNPDTSCEAGGGTITRDGQEFKAHYGFYFVVPAGVMGTFKTLTLRIPATARGLDATVADSVDGIGNASLDGEWVVWTFPRTQFKEVPDAKGLLVWSSQCD